MFQEFDENKDGKLSWKEFKASFRKESMTNQWLLLDFEPQECKELFDLLDDGDGEIMLEEFFEGLSRMRGQAQAKDIYRLQKAIDKIHKAVQTLGVSVPLIGSS